jgi:hypothetical protein
MNNDLSKLSSKELSSKHSEINESQNFARTLQNEKTKEYNKRIARRWTNPVKLITLKKEIDTLSRLYSVLEEYSKTITDEMNKRSRI